ncbi:MAG: sulfite exporter TauE/SafE family protein [Gammaproteobacteria bacterium]|nr:sulfite exporter TauE/SafE family protein [Gammaproteobacteria bacterium]MCY4228907.1 sulfite exporter TauE/SafE family protein [Gammaproteobacteria bacterium]
MIDMLLIMVIFLAAGMVKGVVGMGLPALSLALLCLMTDLTSAIALMLVPAFVTNVYQAFSGGRIVETFRKCPLFFVMAGLAIWPGAQALVRVDLPLLSGLLGICLITYAAVSVAGTRLIGSWSRRWWTGPAFGAANGVLTGLTGAFVFPGLIYLQSIGLSRNELVQAMGILFTISTVFLGLSMGQLSLLTSDLSIQSGLAVIPAMAGMMVGSGIRNRISEILFRRLFFTVLALIGAVLVFNAVVNLP